MDACFAGLQGNETAGEHQYDADADAQGRGYGAYSAVDGEYLGWRHTFLQGGHARELPVAGLDELTRVKGDASSEAEA